MKSSVLMCASVLALFGTTAAIANDTGFAQSTHSIRREGGKICIVDHTHGGDGAGGTKNTALNAAINAFVVTTVDEYGSDWAKWAKAASKTVKYEKTTDGWSAHAEARPCK